MKCKFLQLLLFFFISYPVFSQPPGNKGLYFNGTTSYLEVSVPNSKSATGGDLSIMGWVKPEENAANSTVISRWRVGDINSNYAIVYEPAHERFYVTDVDGYLVLTPNNSVPLGEWTHFTMTYQSATKLVEWYINGSLVSSGTLTTGISANNLQSLRIGAIVNPSNVAVNIWKGQLDEIKIFHTTLSSVDIPLLMNSTAINSLGMVAYWNFNEGTGSVANDVQVNTTNTHANLLGTPPCTWTLRVTTTNDSGIGSLRWAITESNTTSNLDYIDFSISGTGPHTITLLSALPTIDAPVFIDGYSQSGSKPNSLAIGNNAILKIVVNGNGLSDGFRFRANSDNSVIKGLVIHGFTGASTEAAAIHIEGASLANLVDKITVSGCFIGTNTEGTSSVANRNGIFISQFSENIIIGGANPANRNVISGNTLFGITTSPTISNISNITIRNNYIGTNAQGTAAVPNSTGIRFVALAAAQNNVVDGNLISGNTDRGIYAAGYGNNWYINNKIGVASNSTSPIPNNTGIELRGWIGPLISNNNNLIQSNTIAQNANYGIAIIEDSGGALANNITNNAIFCNSIQNIFFNGLVQDGVTPPTITSYPLTGGIGNISGTACSSCHIEVYKDNAGCSIKGGQTFVGSITADIFGNWTLASVSVLPNDVLTATARTGTNSTSAFSSPVTISNTVYYSQSSGNFNDTNRWNTARNGTGTNVTANLIDGNFNNGIATFVIQPGHSITTSSPVVVYDLTLEDAGTSAGTLSLGNQPFHVLGDLLIEGDGDVPDASLTITSANFTVDKTTTIYGELNDTDANGSSSFKGAVTVYGIWNTTSANVSTSLYFFEGVTLGSAALFDAGWAVATYVTPPHEQIFISSGSAAFNIQSLSMPPSGLTIRNQGVLKVGSLINGTLINENKLHLQGSVVGTTIDATSHIDNEVIYDGTSSQSILSIPYHHLSISGSGTKNLLGNITVHGNFHIRNTFSGVFQQNTHTINVKGNWTKEAGTYSSGTGSKILFTGTTDQTFTHNAFVQGLEVNKPTGKVICVAYVGVQDNLHLAQGNIELQSGGILEFNNPSVTLTGSPFDNTKMIITNGGAFKLMLADAVNSNVLIPLGTGTTYSPVHANITPTGSGEFYLTAVQGHANHTPNTGTHSLQRYWTVVTTGITGLTGTLNFSYPPAEVNGTETDYVPARWNGTSWVLEGSPLNVIEGSPLSTINFNVTTHFNFTSHKFTAGEGISFLRVNTNNLTMPETNAPVAYQNYPIYGFSLQAETASTTLNGFKFRTTNTSTYTLSDITSFNLWESSDGIFSPGSDTNLGSFTGDLLPGGEKTIPFSSPFSAGQTKYYFITANVSNLATTGRTIQVETIIPSDFSFSHAFSFTGLPLAAGDTHTIQTALFYSRTSNALDNPTTWNTKADGTGFNAQPHYLNNIETDGVADFIIQGGHIISPASSPVVMNHLSLLDNNTTTRLNLSSQNLIIKGNLTINGDGTAPNPEITLNTGNFTVEGNTSINGELSDNDDNGIDLFKGAVTIGNTGKWNTTAVASSTHLLFEGGITNDGLFNANSARFQTSTNQTLTGTFTFSGDLDVFGGASGTKTVTNIGVITVGNITPSTAGGTPYFVNGANARVNLTGTNYFGDFASHVNTLNFAGNSLQTIVSSSVHHLEVSGIGGAKLSNDLTVLGNLLITSYSSLDMDNYDLFLRGNLTTQNSSSLITNTNTIIFEGNAVQTIRHYSAGDFYHIRINKTGGRVVLDNNITVSDIFEVGTNPLCLLDLNNHTLTITNGTTFLGTYDANHMIIANNGHVRVVFGTPSGTYTQTIPIGTGTIYSPAVFNAVNFVSTGGYLTVSVSNTDGTNVLGGGAYSLNRKWLVSYQNLSLTGGSSTFYYQDSDVSGIETNYLPARYNGIAWSVIGTTTDVYETANLIIIPNPFNGTSAGTQYEFTAGESNAFVPILLPSISLNTTTFSYTEDNPPISLFNAVHISSYSNSLSSAVVRFIGTYLPTQDTLIYTPTPNFSVQWNDNAGLLFISSPLGTTDYENFLANVRYRNTSNAPTVGIRTIEVYVVDGFGQSNIESVTVNVNAVNDAPTFTTSPISWQATEDTPLEIATSALITNAGGKDEDGVPVHGIAITSVNSLHGTWSYSTNGINWINLPNNLSNSNALLLLNHSRRKLRFIPSANFSGNISNALRFRLWDGTNGLAETTFATITTLAPTGAYSINEVVINLNVVEENDPPTFDLIGTLITLTEDAPLTVINLATNIHDGDNGTQPLTFTVSSTLVSGNLTFSVLSMNQLGQLSIQPMPNTYGEATLSIRLSDGALTTIKTVTVQVSPINDAPIVTLLVPHWQVLEDASLASRKVISASDLEGNPLTYSVAALTGSTLLNTLYMLGEELWVKPNQNANGTAILEITVSDGMLETKVQLTIEIIPVNDAPIVTLLVPHWRISEDEGLVSHRIVQAYDVENSTLNYTVKVVNRTGNLEFDTLYMKGDTLWVKTKANTFGKAKLEIAVSDGSLDTTVQMTLEVDPVNDPPIFVLSADSVLLSENFVGEVSITAELLIEEDNEEVIFRLMPSPSEISFMQVRFDSLSGRITLQSIPNRFGTVRLILTADDGLLQYQDTVYVHVEGENSPPTDILLSSTSMIGNPSVGYVVGTIKVVDADDLDEHVLSLVSGTGSQDNEKFEIVGDKLQTKVRLDYKQQQRFSVRIRAADDLGEAIEKSFELTMLRPVSNVEDSLTLVALNNFLRNALPWLGNIPIYEWNGVHIEENRVVGLNLSGYNLDTLNAEILKRLEKLNDLNVSSNALDFHDLLPLASLGIRHFSYTPQKEIGKREELFIALQNDDEKIILHARPKQPTGSIYQWLRNEEALSNNGKIEGSNQSSLIIRDAEEEDGGIFVCEVSHPNLPGLTLRTQPLIVNLHQFLLLQDSLALVAIRNLFPSRQGGRSEDWTEGYASTWRGVRVRRNRVIGLDLSERQMSGALPKEIGNLTALRRLNLFKNNITTLPHEIGALKELEYLDLDGNALKEIPAELFNLEKLKTLWLSRNQLEKLPNGIDRLKNLQYLFLHENRFKELPAEIRQLAKLEILNISKNELHGELNLAGLSTLKNLRLHDNQITKLVVEGLVKLEEVDVDDNELEAFPFSRIEHPALKHVSIRRNRLTFEDLEAPVLENWVLNYVPQKRFSADEELFAQAGERLEKSLDIGGTANEYAWYKNGIRLDGQTTHRLQLTNVTLNDAAVYELRVRNTKVAGLELQSGQLRLVVGCGASLVLESVDRVQFCSNTGIDAKLRIRGGDPSWDYRWYRNGVEQLLMRGMEVTATEVGTYEVRAKDNNGCQRISNTIKIEIVRAPVVRVREVSEFVLEAEGEGEGEYQWYRDGVLIAEAKGKRYEVEKRGTYWVKFISKTTGCEAFSEAKKFGVTSLDESHLLSEIDLYPNPATDHLSIQVNKALTHDMEIELINVSGILVKTWKLSPTTTRYHLLRIEDLPSGIYFLRIHYDDLLHTKRFTKQ